MFPVSCLAQGPFLFGQVSQFNGTFSDDLYNYQPSNQVLSWERARNWLQCVSPIWASWIWWFSFRFKPIFINTPAASKIELASKVVKIHSKIIISLPWSKSLKLAEGSKSNWPITPSSRDWRSDVRPDHPTSWSNVSERRTLRRWPWPNPRSTTSLAGLHQNCPFPPTPRGSTSSPNVPSCPRAASTWSGTETSTRSHWWSGSRVRCWFYQRFMSSFFRQKL